MDQFPQINEDDEVDLAELFANLWRRRLVIVLLSLIGILIGASYFLVRWYTNPTEVTTSVEVRFTFNGIQSGTYPSGLAFSINDLVSVNILGAVYDKMDLESYGLSREDFRSSLLIAPFSTNREFIEARFKNVLYDKDLTTAEINELNQNYSRELQASNLRFAKLTMTVPAALAIPRDKLERVVGAVVEEWAKESIATYGVLDIADSKPNEFDNALVNGYEYMISTLYLEDYLQNLLGTLAVLEGDELARLQIDPETGYTVSSLKTDLGDTKKFHLDVLSRSFSISPIAKDPKEAKFYLNNEILTKKEKLDEVKRQAAVISTAYDQYIRGVASTISDRIEKREKHTQPFFNGVMAQYGEDFLTKLMTIGDQLSDVDFKQGLLNRVLNLRLQAETISTDIERLEQNLARFKEVKEGQNSDIDKSRVLREIQHVSTKLVQAKQVIARIVELRQKRILGQTSNLYALNSEPVVEDNFVEKLVGLIKFSILGLLVGGSIGLLLAMLLSAIGKKAE